MLCENLGLGRLPDVAVGGGFSPFMVMHRSQPFLVPDSLSDNQALLLEQPHAPVHGMGKATLKPGDKVLVIGGGTIGC
jgi:threonine dehydrogenase-like Zn-dependent dehydrogenase